MERPITSNRPGSADEDDNKKINLLVDDILQKKELSHLDHDFVREKTVVLLNSNNKIMQKLKKEEYSRFKRSKEHDEMIKSIRSKLREIYGAFMLKGHDKRKEALSKLKEDPSNSNHDCILCLHKSSKERIGYYEEVYKKIFEITGKPGSILDLACGFNPFSYPYLGCRPSYVASDISKEDMEFIRKYFRMMKIKGDAISKDLITDDISSLSEKADMVFLFKALDSLEAVKKNISRKLMASIKSKFIVVSFATQSLGGRKMIKKERRSWFEKLAKRLELELVSFEIPNEIFYVLRRA